MSQILKGLAWRSALILDYITSTAPLPGRYMDALIGEQFSYGHRESVVYAAGLPRQAVLWGYLPHGGWGDHWFLNGARRTPLGRELPQWMWNESWAQTARERGAKRAMAIGAPWLYELRNQGVPSVWELGAGASTRLVSTDVAQAQVMYIPTHSWEVDPIIPDDNAKRLADTLDPNRTVVVLGWGEFLTKSVRENYINRGFKVETAGFRSSSLYYPWSSLGDRAYFMANLLGLMGKVDIVVSDTPGTALLYAASMGKAVWVLPEMLPTSRSGSLIAENQRVDLIREFDWMVAQPTTAFHYLDHLDHHLGFTSMLNESELRNVLEWKVLALPGL